MLQINAMLNDSVALVRDTCSEESFIQYRKAAGKVMGATIVDILNPINEAYPELTPDYLGGEYTVDPSIFTPRFYQSLDR